MIFLFYKSMGNYYTHSLFEIAGHSSLKSLKLPDIIFNLLKLFSVIDFAIIC
jgi:hypothetical protein